MNSFDNLNRESPEKDVKYEKHVQKRRSSVFHSRTVLSDNGEAARDTQHSANENVAIENTAACTSEVVEKEEFDLEKYINKLKEERKMWQKTWKQRKAQRRKLMEQKSEGEINGRPLNLNVLTNSEIAFVTAKPNYEDINRNNKKLTDMALKLAILNKLAHKLNQRFILRMEERVHSLTEEIIKKSEE